MTKEEEFKEVHDEFYKPFKRSTELILILLKDNTKDNTSEVFDWDELWVDVLKLNDQMYGDDLLITVDKHLEHKCVYRGLTRKFKGNAGIFNYLRDGELWYADDWFECDIHDSYRAFMDEYLPIDYSPSDSMQDILNEGID